ncbi:undecaprenyl-phosphate galactose phosphotransferase WbaP [Acidithiobacillus thiooxidans]|uniref:undecaprenyl-phosphate galactose phosphotransferase WbaP n=1 Tax=Acidithiobacillus thiooxidans TaxID=930 RepID=UPI001D02160F|nr:undecaprenyl-phosphate galactose phosphotransferase WbaP [Acidithiobacillus thiooxidans]
MATIRTSMRTHSTFQWSSWTPFIMALGDILAFLAAFYFARLSHALYYDINPLWVLQHWWGSLAQINTLLFLILTVSVIISFAIKGHYSQRKAFWDEAGDVLAVLILFIALNSAIAFIGKWPLSRLWLFSTWGLVFLFLPVARHSTRWMLARLGAWAKPVVIIGCGKNALEAIRALTSEPLLGYSIKKILIPDNTCLSAERQNYPPVGMEPLSHDPIGQLADLGNPHVVLALDMEQWEAQEHLVRTLGFGYPRLTIAPPLRGLPLFGLEVMHFFSQEVFMLRVRDNLARPGPRILKRIFDLLAASLIIIAVSPVLAYLSWKIKSEDGGKIFFAQERVGHNGKTFRCFKFRSMVHDAEAKLSEYLETNPDIAAEYSRNFKLRNDPRVTRTGRLLRATSLDELPQLFNVLLGQMSLVGPRPLLAREINRYGDGINLYAQVKPGITGLWQVSGRSETTFADRADLDAWYVKNWSLWYDIVILLRTIKVVFSKSGAY